MGEVTTHGKIAIIFGIIGVIAALLVLYNNIFSYISFVCALIAIGLGESAKKKEDKYGKYAMILGLLSIVLMIVVAGLVYMYISSSVF